MGDDYATIKRLAEANEKASSVMRALKILPLYADYPSVVVLHAEAMAEQALIEPLFKPWAKYGAKRDGGGSPTAEDRKMVLKLGVHLKRHAQLMEAFMRELKRARLDVEKKERSH